MGRSTARRRPTRQISRARRTMSRQRWISRWQANLFPRRKPNHTGARSSINPRSFAAAVADRSRSGVTDAGYKFSKRRSNTTAAIVYIMTASCCNVASCSLEMSDISPNRHENDCPWLDRKIQSVRGESRDNKRKIGIGIIRARNITSFIANPGMTSGRSASNPASPWRTTCSAVT